MQKLRTVKENNNEYFICIKTNPFKFVLKLTTLCGILGIWAKNKNGQQIFNKVDVALNLLKHRGPDNVQFKNDTQIALGHCRLSIVDLSENANQPFFDESGNYALIFNGEIYNYKELKETLLSQAITFKTDSDTEVLLKLLINEGKNALEKLNGFFSFVFYDKKRNYVLAARDRIGIKPLLYQIHDDFVAFSSELKPFLVLNNDNKVSKSALQNLLSFTYVASPNTIVQNVHKLNPGHYIEIRNDEIEIQSYYQIHSNSAYQKTYIDAQTQLRNLLADSVKKRLVADVPVGCFLSGGVDSSIIAFLAKQTKKDLNTFSIGFKNSVYNESNFAEKVAKHIGSNHHTIELDKKDFQENFYSFLDSLDEPFADSSAFAVYLLSKYTAKHVKVALSGDGADELFGGYQKHLAVFKIQSQSNFKKNIIVNTSKLFKKNSYRRDSAIGNLKRKIKKYADGIKLNASERYINWCKWSSDADVSGLLKEFNPIADFNFQINLMDDVLIADQNFVLPNDMLKKVDAMSMAHSLEVRVPFLDHRMVEFANSLPIEFKINKQTTKKILRDTFKSDLPSEVFTRSKKGFEIPLVEWLKEPIQEIFEMPYFQKSFIVEQNLFNHNTIIALKKEYDEDKIGERIYLLWTLIIFQNWYYKNLMN